MWQVSTGNLRADAFLAAVLFVVLFVLFVGVVTFISDYLERRRLAKMEDFYRNQMARQDAAERRILDFAIDSPWRPDGTRKIR